MSKNIYYQTNAKTGSDDAYTDLKHTKRLSDVIISHRGILDSRSVGCVVITHVTISDSKTDLATIITIKDEK